MKNSSNSDEYFRIKEECRHEIKVKDSRFIATALPVDSEEEVELFISRIKKEFHDASHNCSAWRIGLGNQLRFRYSDDGEPAGTAGRPILKAMEIRRLSNVCIVVTRYFGGKKLGTGGLMRAYGEIAGELLKKCQIEKKYITTKLTFSAGFDFVGVIHNIINNFKVELKETRYEDDVIFMVDVRSAQYPTFKEKLTEATNGEIRFR